MLDTKTFAALLEKWRRADITPAEAELLMDAIHSGNHEEYLLDSFDSHLRSDEFRNSVVVSGSERVKDSLLRVMDGWKENKRGGLRYILRWWHYAAAAVVVALVTVLLLNLDGGQPSATSTASETIRQSSANKVVLTLANGKKIELDPAASERIEDGNLSIDHQKGELKYDVTEIDAMNTMTTPRGAQYRLTLSDGTRIWLNAASSVTYPVAFNSRHGSRVISVSGEAYIEAAPDPHSPFIVQIANCRVEVLGTRFNINGYGDNAGITASLLEGKIKLNAGQESLILEPMRAAKVDNTKNNIRRLGAIEENDVLAWKNGLFNFDRADVRSIMNEISRWYDIDIHYAGDIPDFHYGGKIPRNSSLTEIVNILSAADLNVQLQGKTLTVK